MKRWGAGSAIAATAVVCLLTACTGGKESNAAEEQLPKKNPIAADATKPATAPSVDAQKELRDISHAIPIYAGAQYRDDLTRRDEVMIRNQYGPQSKVYTMATDDSYPQVYHYY